MYSTKRKGDTWPYPFVVYWSCTTPKRMKTWPFCTSKTKWSCLILCLFQKLPILFQYTLRLRIGHRRTRFGVGHFQVSRNEIQNFIGMFDPSILWKQNCINSRQKPNHITSERTHFQNRKALYTLEAFWFSGWRWICRCGLMVSTIQYSQNQKGKKRPSTLQTNLPILSRRKRSRRRIWLGFCCPLSYI